MSSGVYDVAVLGAGSAGYAAARTCAAAGLKTAVIEGGEQVGGLCILRGCMPTKALLQSAEVLHAVQRSAEFGVRAGPAGFDLKEIMARKDRLIGEFAAYRRSQLESGKFTFVRARASFVDPHTLALRPGGELRAQHFILATGSVIAPSPVPGLDPAACLTSDSALVLEKLPKSLLVLGAGAVGVEFAQFFARLGVAVTLIQRSPRILREEDPEAAAVVEQVFRREGMTVLTGTNLLEAWQEGGQKGVTFEREGRIERAAAEEIFYGLGRVPNLAGLQLENAGVRVESGWIGVNAAMRTGVPHIYAAGDCSGLHEIVHIAIQQGETAARNIAHPASPREMDYRLLASVVFTDPQLGRVGLTEAEARRRGIPHLSASYPFNDHGKSLIMGATDGFVKLLACPRTGEILGGACVGPHGGELIHEVIAAMHKRMTVHELAAMPHYHPTLAEIWTYPAEELADQIPLAAG